jgi:hypothetical protein
MTFSSLRVAGRGLDFMPWTREFEDDTATFDPEKPIDKGPHHDYDQN